MSDEDDVEPPVPAGLESLTAPQRALADFLRLDHGLLEVAARQVRALPALRRSAHPRIVSVSSGTGSLAWSTGPNPQFDHQTAGTGAAYRSSKTALTR